jgi:hypothetical protein
MAACCDGSHHHMTTMRLKPANGRTGDDQTLHKSRLTLLIPLSFLSLVFYNTPWSLNFEHLDHCIDPAVTLVALPNARQFWSARAIPFQRPPKSAASDTGKERPTVKRLTRHQRHKRSESSAGTIGSKECSSRDFNTS